VAWRQASDTYETLTSLRMRGAPRRDVLASASARVTSRVTLAAGWQAQDVRGQGGPGDIRRASLTSTASFGRRLSLFLSAVRSQYDRVWSTGGFAALSLSIGPRRNASLSAQSIDRAVTGAVDVQQSAPIGPGIGYRVQASGLGAGSELLDGELRAQARWAQLDVRQTFDGGRRETWAQVNGALVAIGGRVLATRPVQSGFALVRVPDVKGVRAYVSQQEMGRTDSHGDLLLPNLLPFYGNQISIADSDVPVDRTLTRKQLLLATPYRGGAIAEFPATREWRAAGTVAIEGDAEALRGQRALDATLTVQTPAGAVETWLAADGAFYIEGLAPGRYEARVVSGAVACAMTLDVPASDAPVVRLGTLTCRPPMPEEGR
jgi:outer membrane usher protein